MNNKNSKTYDLEERTFEFAKNVRRLVKKFIKPWGMSKMDGRW